jgi:hypothetical protein
MNQFVACRTYLALRRYEEAIDACERGSSAGEYWVTHVYLAIAYAQTGRDAKAAAARDRALARRPEMTIAWFRQSTRQVADHPKLWEQFDTILEPGLRKAGFAEKLLLCDRIRQCEGQR